MVSLVFSTSSGWVSWLIRNLTGSKASHAALCVTVLGVTVVIESTVGGVRLFPRARWQKGKMIVEEYAFVPDVTARVSQAIQHIGDKYDYAGLFGYLWAMIGRRFHKRWKNPFASSTAQVCSEFIVRLDPKAEQIREWEGLDPETTTPQDLIRLCRLGTSFRPVVTP